MTNRDRSIEELYRDDPERADALVFGRRAGADRRGFLGGAGIAAMSAAVGATIPFAANMPAGLIPAAMAQGAAPAPAAAPQGPRLLEFPGKERGLVLLQERPLVAETPEQMLDDETTPTQKFFIRNNGQIPDVAANRDGWTLKIDGEVNSEVNITLADLKRRFTAKTFRLQMECGGNGRSFFQPATSGNQWGNGAVGVAEWTGVSLGDVLRTAGLKSSAVYTANFGADPHLSGDAARPSISRGTPIAKAMEEHTLLAWAMNGQDLPHIHGGPLRILSPGWPGSVSHKWVTRIWIRDREHDGPGMTGTQYRVPINPMVPGSRAVDANMRVLESMPLRSIISNPANGTRLPAGTRMLALRGAAWAGEKSVRAMHVSVDFGATWLEANLAAPKNKYDWQRWTANVRLPSDGYYELWCRGTDSDGMMQPHAPANWNPQGYGANSFHRIAVLVG